MKYLALDIGNVICHVELKVFLQDLSQIANISLEEALYFTNRHQKVHDLGLTSMKNDMKEYLKIQSPVIINKLLASWDECILTNYEVLDAFNHLADNHEVQIALLSNIGPEHAELMDRRLSHNGFLNKSIKHFSCEIGARKPTDLFYQSFLWTHPEFKGCVYVDDALENLATGKKFGFQPYHFALDKMKVADELVEIQKLVLEGD